jgi:hypothetical protein
MRTARVSRVRHADLKDGDLVCWNCGERLIAGYAGLVAAAGPVPLFGEMTIACNICSSANRSVPAASAAAQADVRAVPSARRSARSPMANREDGGDGP